MEVTHSRIGTTTLAEYDSGIVIGEHILLTSLWHPDLASLSHAPINARYSRGTS